MCTEGYQNKIIQKPFEIKSIIYNSCILNLKAIHLFLTEMIHLCENHLYLFNKLYFPTIIMRLISIS